jgi:PAS domain-containing protein
MSAAERIIVEDVTQSDIFRGEPALGVLVSAGVRAVQSTPLVSSRGEVVGMISTHFTQLHRPDERDLGFIDLLARQAADLIERNHTENALDRMTLLSMGGAGSPLVSLLFTDITDRKRAEVALRESEERQTFLLKLSDALRPLTDPVAVQTTAMQLLAERLDVMRARGNRVGCSASGPTRHRRT